MKYNNMMLWKKPADMKYTDMCIYIDEHVKELLDPNCPEELKNTIYNYLWLLVKALAIKHRMFNSFQDYDGYSFYAANRLYFALKKNLENQGKVIKGKEIKPIKSCLNYTKTLLYPMKIEYLREEYKNGISEAQTSKNFDEFLCKQRFKEGVWQSQGGSEDFRDSVYDFCTRFNDTLEEVLKKAPFQKGTVDYQWLKLAVLLNVYMNIKKGRGLTAEPITVITWKLPKSTSNYIKLFIKELGTAMKQEIMLSYSHTQIDDKILDYMISHPEGEFIDHETKD